MTDAVRADTQALLDMLNATPMAHLETLGVDQARALMQQMRAAQPPTEDGLAIVRDLDCPSEAGAIRLRLYDARAERPAGPVMVYYHGGGFVLGDLDSHHATCVAIAHAVDIPVVAVDYRLAPEHPWPAAPDDAETAARWVAEHALSALGREAASLVLAGDSAGANLAAVTAGALTDRPTAIPVAAQFLIYPTTGGDRQTESRARFASLYFLTGPAIDWFNACYAAPASDPRYDLFARGSLEALPPTLLVTAGLDPLRDEGRAYAAALVEAGVAVTFQEAAGTIHGFFGMTAAMPSVAEDVRKALAALREMIAS